MDTPDAKPSPSQDEDVWPVVRKLVATSKHLIEEGRLGLLVAFFTAVYLNAKDIAAIFHFPPADRPFAKFLVFVVALGVWDLTRIWLRTQKSNKIKFFWTKIAFGLSVVIFTLYFSLSGSYVVEVDIPQVEVATRSKNNHREIVFFQPLWPSDDFISLIKTQSGQAAFEVGFRFLADNDPYWLKDQLENCKSGVLATKIALIFSIVFATTALVFSSTAVSLSDHKR